MSYTLNLADSGLNAVHRQPTTPFAGLNIYQGQLTYRAVAEAFGLKFVDPLQLILGH